MKCDHIVGSMGTMPFSKHATASDVLQGFDLSGQTAFVTGGNSGIGWETARALAGAGARVLLTSRSLERCQQAAKLISAQTSKGEVVVKQLDLADLASVQRLAEELLLEQRLDMIILNAGIMGGPLAHTSAGFEMQLGTNHMGHFALVEPLIGYLREQVHTSRVVVVSSVAHKLLQHGPLDLNDLHYQCRRYSPYAAYSQSKTANILFAKHLAIKLHGSNSSAFSVHPGVVMGTGLTRQAFTPSGAMHKLYALALRHWLKTPHQGAATQVWAATARGLEEHSGAYLQNCAVTLPSAIASDLVHAAELWAVTRDQIQQARDHER